MNARRASRWLGAAVLAVLGLLAAVGGAQALPAPATAVVGTTRLPGATSPDPALIPHDATGRITIHQLLLDPGASPGLPGDGTTGPTPPGAGPLAGMTYTVTRVDGVDLTTTTGWQQATAYAGDGVALARTRLGASVTSAPTGADGVTVVAGLPVGLYLVHALGVMRADGTPDPSVTTGSDVLVTVPMTDPEHRQSWLFDIHVYPKSSGLTLTKSVADGNAGVSGEDAPVAGRVLTYTLSADIPDPAGTGYRLVDDLATAVVPGSSPARQTSDYLAFSDPSWSGAVRVTLTTDPAAALTGCTTARVGCDYVLDRTPSAVSVSMTGAGLARLTAAKAASPLARVVLTAQARVRASVTAATAHGPLVLPNTARLFPDARSIRSGRGVVSNAVRSTYATLRLHKIDRSTGSALWGAGFTLYRTRADAEAGRDPLAVSGITGADGMAEIAGVHVTDVENDAPASDAYWLVESTVPKGFTGLAEPVAVQLGSDGRTIGADATGGRPVPNAKGALAYTGADVVWLLVLGLALVLVGGLLAVAARRRETRAEAVTTP